MLCCSAINEMETETETEQGSEDASQVSVSPGGLYGCRRAGFSQAGAVDWVLDADVSCVTRDTKYDTVALHMHTCIQG